MFEYRFDDLYYMHGGWKNEIELHMYHTISRSLSPSFPLSPSLRYLFIVISRPIYPPKLSGKRVLASLGLASSPSREPRHLRSTPAREGCVCGGGRRRWLRCGDRFPCWSSPASPSAPLLSVRSLHVSQAPLSVSSRPCLFSSSHPLSSLSFSSSPPSHLLSLIFFFSSSSLPLPPNSSRLHHRSLNARWNCLLRRL